MGDGRWQMGAGTRTLVLFSTLGTSTDRFARDGAGSFCRRNGFDSGVRSDKRVFGNGDSNRRSGHPSRGRLRTRRPRGKVRAAWLFVANRAMICEPLIVIA